MVWVGCGVGYGSSKYYVTSPANNETAVQSLIKDLLTMEGENSIGIRATENQFFTGSDRFLVCKTDSVCIKRIFLVRKKHTLQIIIWPNYLD